MFLVGEEYITRSGLENEVEEADNMPWRFIRYGIYLARYGMWKFSSGSWNGESEAMQLNGPEEEKEVTQVALQMLQIFKDHLAVLFHLAQAPKQ
jgi:hypothetical protein